MKKSWKIALLASSAIAVAGAASANSGLAKLINNANNWAHHSGNYELHRHTKLKQINKSNVKNLKVAWTWSTGVLRGHEGGPLVIGNTLYVHTAFPNNVHAIDLNEPGRIIWSYYPKQDPDVIPVMCCDTVNRGLSYGDGKIFLQQADTVLVALDAKSGKLVWSATNGDPSVAQTNTNAPHIMKDKVITGMSGAEFGVQAWVNAYDIKTGKRVWRGYSMGPDDQTLIVPGKTTGSWGGKSWGVKLPANSGTSTWEGDQWKIGGGSVWGWWSYDKPNNSFYYGNGNPSTWNPVQRPGDNKWSMSMWSRDVDSGEANWVFQMTPHDEWDYDGVNESIMADIKVGGKTRKTIVHFDRNGFGYTWDRKTGEPLVIEKFDPATNWSRGQSLKTGLHDRVEKYSTEAGGEDVNTKNICPAALGTKDQQPAAFDPKRGTFAVPTNHVCMDYEPFRVSYTAGQPYVGATLSMFPAPGGTHLGNFISWDGGTGKILWSKKEPFSVWSGALTSAGDVWYYGTLEGYIKGVDPDNGKTLWQFRTPSGIIGNINGWAHGGKQYIGVLSGVGGWAGIGLAAGLTEDTAGLGAVGAYKALHNYTRLGGTLTVFSL